MIDTYLKNGDYQEALKLLTDLDDETVRYQRLICLSQLEQWQEAKKEGQVAIEKAQETYYDVVALYLNILKELEEFDEAIDIVVKELEMPYIPSQYEIAFNTAFDELLLAKQELNASTYQNPHSFSEEELEAVLLKETPDDQVLDLVIDQLQRSNIRRFIYPIQVFLKNKHANAIAKSILLDLLIDQEIDEEMIVCKGEQEYYLNPSYAPKVFDQEGFTTVANLLSDQLSSENPTLEEQCLQFWALYALTIYPRYLDETDYPYLAGAIHYYMMTILDIEVTVDEILVSYNISATRFNELLSDLMKLQF